jgi:hypothetical protein
MASEPRGSTGARLSGRQSQGSHHGPEPRGSILTLLSGVGGGARLQLQAWGHMVAWEPTSRGGGVLEPTCRR